MCDCICCSPHAIQSDISRGITRVWAGRGAECLGGPVYFSLFISLPFFPFYFYFSVLDLCYFPFLNGGVLDFFWEKCCMVRTQLHVLRPCAIARPLSMCNLTFFFYLKSTANGIIHMSVACPSTTCNLHACHFYF